MKILIVILSIIAILGWGFYVSRSRTLDLNGDGKVDIVDWSIADGRANQIRQQIQK